MINHKIGIFKRSLNRPTCALSTFGGLRTNTKAAIAINALTMAKPHLWAAPGGHKPPLRKVFRRVGSDDEGTMFEDLDETPLPDPAKDLVPLEVPAGTMVILNGKLPHWSDVNRSPVSRHAYTLHCISASATYPDWNWLQRPADMPLRRLDRSDRQ